MSTFVLTDSVSGESYIYLHEDDGANGIAAIDITMVGVVNDYTVLFADLA